MKFYLLSSNDWYKIMRITFSQLLIALILSGISYAKSSEAQDVLKRTINIVVNNSSLENTLQKLEENANVKFVYSKSIVKTEQKITFEATGEKLESVLNRLLIPNGITYRIIDDRIVLNNIAEAAKGEVKAIEIATAIIIKGRVIDDKGEALPGVTVKLKGSQTAVSTDIDGNYKLSLADANGVLEFSYIGFTTQQVPINGRVTINVVLIANSSSLNEVVVVGYGTQKRGDVSGAIASVNMKELKDVPATNLSTALQGRVPGLVVTPNSYRPGSGATIKIRGSRSLSADNGPLYVVDGIPITYSIDDINPLDIESIDVLKDAAATAVYGSRGANGVIQITTKKGKTGKLSIDYTGSTSSETILKKVQIYNASEFAQFKRDAYIGSGNYNVGQNAKNPKFYFPDPSSDLSLFGGLGGDPILYNSVLAGYNVISIDPTTQAVTAETRPTTPDEKQFLKDHGYPVLDNIAIYDPTKVKTGFDWQSAALRTGLTQNHNLAVSGGTEKFRSSFSGGYYNQKGIELGQDYTRYSFNLNNDFKPTSFLNLGANVSYSNAIQNIGPDEYAGANGQFPFAKPYDDNGNFLILAGSDPNVVNPLNDVNTVFNEVRINRFLANVFGKVTIFKGLDYRIAFGADMNNARQGTFNGVLSSANAGTAGSASATYQTQYGFVWTLQNQLTYNTTIANKHAITATVVQELQKDRLEAAKFAATNLAYETQKWYSLQNNTLGTVTTSPLPSNLSPFAQHQLVGYLGRVNYAYDSKYILTAGYRLDASSVLSEAHQSQLFPSFSAAWRIDQEKFMRNITFIDQLKLRGGIGAVGNASIQPYLTSGLLNPTPTYYNWGTLSATGYAPQGLPTPDLTWERTTTKNIALDFGFLHNRISGSIDVYESNTNQIQKQSLPSASGYSSVFVNLGKVRNKGIEIGLSTVNLDQPKGLRWTTDITFSANKEAIVFLKDGSTTDDIGNQWFIGRPVRNYNDYRSHGIFQYTDTLSGGILKDYWWKKGTANKAAGSNFQPGKIRVDDINGDTTITDADKVNLGSPNPKWTASINNTFSFKGFDLSTFVYISYGALVRDIRPGLVGRYESVKVNYWTPTNPSNDYQQPNPTSDIPLYWQAISFRDGSFIRVRSILLTYHIPSSLLNKFKISNMSLSFNAVNPFLFSRYKRYDPETVPYTSTYPSNSTANPSASSYSYRSFVFGLRVGL